MRKTNFKKLASFICICMVITFINMTPFQQFFSIPNNIRIFMGSEVELLQSIPTYAKIETEEGPVISVNGTKIYSNEIGTTKVNLKIGKVPIKTFDVQVLPDIRLFPGGQSIGVKLQAAGVLVVGHKEVIDEKNKHNFPAKNADIQIGDMIVKINNHDISEASKLGDYVSSAGEQGKALQIQLIRGNDTIQKAVIPVRDREDQQYKLGLYVRDSAAGVGTLTFYEPNTQKYGALGHIISDLDTQKPIVIGNGAIVPSRVTSVDRGKEGKPGSIRAVFPDDSNSLGSIDKNSPFGIFGKLKKPIGHPMFKEPLPIALIEEVKEGPAEILTVVEGNRIEKYSIEIVNVIKQRYPSTKGMIIKITDPKLLQKTGGIVQGMSGSPIIQNGKIVGAVTHVFVNDPTQGYGLFIEWMLDEVNINLKSYDSLQLEVAA